MNQKIYANAFIWIACLLLLSSHGLSNPRDHSLQTIDLSNEEWGKGVVFSLDHEWMVVWDRFVSSDRFTTEFAANAHRFPISSHWGKVSSSEGPTEPTGFGTFAVAYKVPLHIDKLFLKLPNVASAHRLWINGKLIGEQGTVGRNASEEVAYFRPQTHAIEPDENGRVLIVLHVSNFNYFEGGMIDPPQLTDQSGANRITQIATIISVFIGAVLIATGIYNLSTFAFNRESYAALFFGLLCITVSLRSMMIDERLLYGLLDLSWESLQRIEHLLFYFSFPCFASFFYRLFPSNACKAFAVSSWMTIVPFVCLALFAPIIVMTQYNVLFQMSIILGLIICFALYLHAPQGFRSDRVIFGFSLSVLSISVVNDILKVNSLLETSNLAHIGVLAFCLSQSISLQRSHFKNTRLIHKMSNTLAEKNDQLMRLDELKSEFLVNTSHELRTPLHGISGLAKALTRSVGSNLESQDARKLDLIASTSKRLGVLVNDILDYSSLRGGKLTLNRTPVDSESLLSDVVVTLHPLAQERKVSLSFDIAKPAETIYVDDFRMQQILFNVIGNSIKHTYEGCVSVSLTAHATRLFISVIDEGVGFHENRDLNWISAHDPQLDASSDYPESNGLGLWISKQLIELHGGSIKLERHQTGGAKVIFEIPDGIEPLSEEETEVNTSFSRAHYEPASHPVNSIAGDLDAPLLYLVDDESINLELLTSHLIPEGYRLKAFTHGAALLAELEIEKPHLIILDYMMPAMNGLEVCRTIRRRHSIHDLPIMMLTYKQDMRDIVEALGTGANDYLIKPYHDKELLARIQGLLSISERYQSEAEKTELISALHQQSSQLEQHEQVSKIVEFADDGLLLIDRNLEIRYGNHQAKQLLKSELIEKSVEQVSPALAQAIHSMFASDSAQTEALKGQSLMITDATNNALEGHVRLLERDAHMVVVILNKASLAETKQSQNKTQQANRALSQVEEELGSLADHPEASDAYRNSLVALHRETLNVWERSTHQSKAKLAEESGLWRVYLDGTTVKTRTYDKYLQVKTLPRNPRWRSVIRTANYVLSTCEVLPEEKERLIKLIGFVEIDYA